jgi:dTDP-4-amino-4,6-dideoxygalactose transaminase
MQPIIELAHDHGIKVIEDCAQAQGAEYYGRPAGSIGDIGTFSFCQDKIMTTGGEGGMLTTNDRTLWEKAWSHKDHGKSPSVMDGNSPSTAFRWVHDSFGTNWRMTEMQAAIGRVALRRIPLWLELRRRNAAYLTRSFQAIPALRIPQPFPEIKHAYYKFYAFVRPERLKNDWDRDRVLEAIMEEGASCYTGTCSEVYLEKAFSQFRLQPEKRLPVAQELGENSLMFLVHPTLNLSELEHTCRAVARVFERASVPWLGSSELLGQPGLKIADRPLPEVGSVFFQVDNESKKSRQPPPMDPFSDMDD